MAHINVNTYKTMMIAASVLAAPIELEPLKGFEQKNEIAGELNDDRGTDTETLNKSSEEPLQPSGGDERALLGESGGSDGTLAEQTNTDNDVAGLGTAKTKAKPKSGAK